MWGRLWKTCHIWGNVLRLVRPGYLSILLKAERKNKHGGDLPGVSGDCQEIFVIRFLNSFYFILLFISSRAIYFLKRCTKYHVKNYNSNLIRIYYNFEVESLSFITWLNNYGSCRLMPHPQESLKIPTPRRINPHFPTHVYLFKILSNVIIFLYSPRPSQTYLSCRFIFLKLWMHSYLL